MENAARHTDQGAASYFGDAGPMPLQPGHSDDPGVRGDCRGMASEEIRAFDYFWSPARIAAVCMEETLSPTVPTLTAARKSRRMHPTLTLGEAFEKLKAAGHWTGSTAKARTYTLRCINRPTDTPMASFTPAYVAGLHAEWLKERARGGNPPPSMPTLQRRLDLLERLLQVAGLDPHGVVTPEQRQRMDADLEAESQELLAGWPYPRDMPQVD